MKYNISKELFKVVVGHSCTFINGYGGNFIIVIDEESGDDLYDLSIDSFFFKCKEWALEQGYEIFTSGVKCSIYEIGNDWIIDQLESDSEQQAVFDACMWLLENKDK